MEFWPSVWCLLYRAPKQTTYLASGAGDGWNKPEPCWRFQVDQSTLGKVVLGFLQHTWKELLPFLQWAMFEIRNRPNPQLGHKPRWHWFDNACWYWADSGCSFWEAITQHGWTDHTTDCKLDADDDNASDVFKSLEFAVNQVANHTSSKGDGVASSFNASLLTCFWQMLRKQLIACLDLLYVDAEEDPEPTLFQKSKHDLRWLALGYFSQVVQWCLFAINGLLSDCDWFWQPGGERRWLGGCSNNVLYSTSPLKHFTTLALEGILDSHFICTSYGLVELACIVYSVCHFLEWLCLDKEFMIPP